MKLIELLINMFKKTKKLAVSLEEKIVKFITEHKNEIRMTMRILEVIFPAGTGSRKMRCVVNNICSALGYDSVSDEVYNFIMSKCQEVYDEFKSVIQ